MVLSDYAKGALQNPGALIALARQAGVPVIVDPKRADLSAYRGAAIITPNAAEFEAVAGRWSDDADLEQRARRLVDELDFGAILVTRGEQGMTLVQRDGACVHLPTMAQEVFDVTGAGDTVVASLAMGLASGMDLADAAALSNVAAGVVVAKLGTADVSRQELQRALDAQHPDEHGVLAKEDLLRHVARARARGERVVMTNGCFDILHPGHVAYLEQAAALGDRLVVAVNDDASVSRLKGPDRPVNTLSQRAAVLAGLRSVDWVVPFTEDTPERLICAVRPDCLVKGGDYRPGEIAGGDCVREGGGEVVVLDYLEGFSTTAIIQSLSRDAGA
jgi:D-beta-D-heptose 7-phosphate kinase/D-beta-D-heptose 1-phosphate adenosyltransferase